VVVMSDHFILLLYNINDGLVVVGLDWRLMWIDWFGVSLVVDWEQRVLYSL